jgi:hypothetical protein
MTALGILKQRSWYYIAINVGIVLAAAVSTALGSDGDRRSLYVVLLAAICTSPLLKLEQLNGRYTLLSAFMAVYFLYFGMADLLGLFHPPAFASSGLLTAAEVAVLLGGALLLLGYHFAVRSASQAPRPAVESDWSSTAVIVAGLALWAIGTAAVWYWSVHVIVRRSVEIDNDLGALGTTIVMLGRLIQPLGIMMLAYGLALTRRKWLLLLILGIVAFQVVLGFISDSKETAMRGAVLVILVMFLVQGRLPKSWLAGSALFIVLAFPIFQAYRYEVTGLRGVTNAQAASNLGELLKIAYEAKDKVASGFYGADVRGQSFIERASLKGNVTLIVERTGHGVRYQHGGTLQPLLTMFIPRLIWPDKPDVQAGQLMNREFGIAYEQDVYISPSHLGELYWNFGWPGVIVGMFGLGALLGYINGRWDLSRHSSLTSLLIVSITIYSLCLRFEGTIATSYAVWIRSLLAVGLMHLLFSRMGVVAGARQTPLREAPEQGVPIPANLMR